MLVIKIWCLPIQGEEKLNNLHRSIVSAVVSINELGLKDEKDMMVLFPSDLMKYGLGKDIIIEISGLSQEKHRTTKVLQRLAEETGKTVKNLYPKAKVECFIQTFNSKQGFWVSESETENKDASPKLSETLDTSWSKRLLNSLMKAGIETENQLLATSAVDILKLPNLGWKTFNELGEWLREKGYTLKDLEKITNLLKQGYSLLYIKSKLI